MIGGRTNLGGAAHSVCACCECPEIRLSPRILVAINRGQLSAQVPVGWNAGVDERRPSLERWQCMCVLPYLMAPKLAPLILIEPPDLLDMLIQRIDLFWALRFPIGKLTLSCLTSQGSSFHVPKRGNPSYCSLLL